MAEGPAITGYVDTQWGYNFDQPGTRMTALRSYDALDNNIRNTAHLALAGSMDTVGYVVELDAGHDAPITAAGGTTNEVVLQEAYLTWMGASRLGFKAGKFATYQGIEVIENPANPTITRGFLYGLAEPFTHVGAVATYALDRIDFAAGVVNGWDLTTDNNSGKTLVGKVGFNFGDPLTFSISGYHGPEQAAVTSTTTSTTINNGGKNRSSIDLTGVTKIIPNVDLWFQANMGSEDAVLDNDGDLTADDSGEWSGFTVQPVVRITDKFSIGGRYEYFEDDGSRTGTTDLALNNFTITPAYKVNDSVTLRAEYRQDGANKKVWIDDKGVAQDTASTATLQAVVAF